VTENASMGLSARLIPCPNYIECTFCRGARRALFMLLADLAARVERKSMSIGWNILPCVNTRLYLCHAGGPVGTSGSSSRKALNGRDKHGRTIGECQLNACKSSSLAQETD
jgi:hypothetical protein